MSSERDAEQPPSRTDGSKTETSLWSNLRRAQENYARTLSNLDSLIWNGSAGDEMSRTQLEAAGAARAAAYREYRAAMDELMEFLRR